MSFQLLHLRSEVEFLRQRLGRWEADDGTPVPLAAVLAAEQRHPHGKSRAASAGVRRSGGGPSRPLASARRSSVSSGAFFFPPQSV